MKGVLENILALISSDQVLAEEQDKVYTVEEVFPEGITPGEVLRGFRYREGLTQTQLAALVGIKAANISEMEKGRRPIGKEMAKRLAKALKTRYRVFL